MLSVTSPKSSRSSNFRPAPETPESDVTDNGIELDQLAPQKGRQRQDDAGGKTAGRGDELGRLQPRAMDFRHAVDRLGQQLGRGMIVIVKFLVDGGIGRAEIGAQIDHGLARLAQRDGIRRGGAVRARRGKEIGLLREGESGAASTKVSAPSFSSGVHELDLESGSPALCREVTSAISKDRMPGEIVQQFLPGITGSTDDRRTYGLQLWPFSSPVPLANRKNV